ncbi:YHYH protein [Candidatus Gracilibacteria bacterium 28_42_T64]|nr:YHYH protein [Candidatus Gracilibacteria bacterium 28_42_T64]
MSTKKYLITGVIISIVIGVLSSAVMALPAKGDYKTNSNFLSSKSIYKVLLKNKYSSKIESLSDTKLQILVTKIDELISKYENDRNIDDRKRLKIFSLLHALRDVVNEDGNNQSITQKYVPDTTPDTIEKYELGDGKISSSPKIGYIYSCVTRFGGGGAWKDGDWIDGNYWYPSKKTVHVDGNVSWDGEISFTLQGDKRVISGNGVPEDHNTGVFPVSRNDDAYNYDRNPNSIDDYKIYYSLPANPKIAGSASCVGMGTIGISTTGVALFNGLDAVGRDAVAHEIQDNCEGHPERDGVYHYHNIGSCLEDSVEDTTNGSAKLVGYALDGFGIYGNQEDGKNLTNDDLDECHGHSHTISWDGTDKKIYHYHATANYPYMVGCFKGTPVK